ncbi:MAG: hypothetical protein Q7S90_09715 [Rubrivivax sp.]|nr:hypothetical protein [Rubrivivax sp.]
MRAVHFDRQGLRRTVWGTLVAWLLALSAGVVNACMLTPQGTLGGDAASALRYAAHTETSSRSGEVVHGNVVDSSPRLGQGQGQGQDVAKDSCLKFCDDESSALSAGKIPALDPGVPLLAAIAPWSSSVPNTFVGTRLSLQRPPAQGPPLVIRLLRLTR